MSAASSGSRAPSTTTRSGSALGPPAASTHGCRPKAERDGQRHVGGLAGRRRAAVVDVDVAVHVGNAGRPGGVSQPGERAGHEPHGEVAAEHERPLACV